MMTSFGKPTSAILTTAFGGQQGVAELTNKQELSLAFQE